MNPVLLVLLTVAGLGAGALLLAVLIDYSRALSVVESEAIEYRRRLQVAHLVVADLVDRPHCEVARSFGREWIERESGVDDPHRVLREASRLAAKKDRSMKTILLIALLFTACTLDGWPHPVDLPDDAGDDVDVVEFDVATPDPCADALACAAMYVDSYAGDECMALEPCRSEWPDCIGLRADELGCVPCEGSPGVAANDPCCAVHQCLLEAGVAACEQQAECNGLVDDDTVCGDQLCNGVECSSCGDSP